MPTVLFYVIPVNSDGSVRGANHGTALQQAVHSTETKSDLCFSGQRDQQGLSGEVWRCDTDSEGCCGEVQKGHCQVWDSFITSRWGFKLPLVRESLDEVAMTLYWSWADVRSCRLHVKPPASHLMRGAYDKVNKGAVEPNFITTYSPRPWEFQMKAAKAKGARSRQCS